MPALYEDKIKRQGLEHLEDGERVLAAFIAQPRGATIAKVGGVAPGAVGGRKMAQQRRAAEEGGLKLTTPMALALTDRRLVVFAVSQPIAMGKGGDVTQLFSAVPRSDVDSIEVKRLLVGKVVIVTVRGSSVKLEVGPGANAKGLAAELAPVVGPRRPPPSIGPLSAAAGSCPCRRRWRWSPCWWLPRGRRRRATSSCRPRR